MSFVPFSTVKKEKTFLLYSILYRTKQCRTKVTNNFVPRKLFPRMLVSSRCFTGHRWRNMSRWQNFGCRVILSDIVLSDKIKSKEYVQYIIHYSPVGKITVMKCVFVNSALKMQRHVVKIYSTDCFFGDFAHWEIIYVYFYYLFVVSLYGVIGQEH